MINKTMRKFGYPNTLIKEYNYWCLLLRPQQVTLGSLVLICKEDATSFSLISSEAFKEYPEIIIALENVLKKIFSYDKINYLMLMMVDPNVHFHIIPRYNTNIEFNGTPFQDFGWPGPPDFAQINVLDDNSFNGLKEILKKIFSASRKQ